MNGGFISQIEAARILGLSQGSVSKLIDSGRIASVHITEGGKCVRRISAEAVRDFAERYAPTGRLKRRRYKSLMSRKPVEPKPPRITSHERLGFVTQAEAARRVGVSQAAISKWVINGRLKSVKNPEGISRRITLADLESLVADPGFHQPLGRSRKAPEGSVTKAEAAELCGLSLKKFQYLCVHGSIPGVIKRGMGKDRIYPRAAIESYVASCQSAMAS